MGVKDYAIFKDEDGKEWAYLRHTFKDGPKSEEVKYEPTKPKAGEFRDVKESAFKEQIGGDHYKTLAIQPIEYSEQNRLTPLEHTAIKYVTRHRFKDGVKDIDKAIHTLKMLRDMYYSEESINIVED